MTVMVEPVCHQVVILAQGFILGGRLEGTEELVLERGSTTTLTDSAHTNLRYKVSTQVLARGSITTLTDSVHTNLQYKVTKFIYSQICHKWSPKGPKISGCVRQIAI
jgi:hypothetical protein